MNSFQCFFKNENGQSMVSLTVLITVILGFTALVVDIGLVVIENQKLQNTIDAVALASVQELPDTDAALQVANEYIELNGYTSNDISANISSNEISISANKHVDYYFANILGFSGIDLNKSASASIGGSSHHQIFDYALFSGSSSRKLTINGSDFFTNGNVHTNNSFQMNGSKHRIEGVLEAVECISVNGSDIYITEQIEYADYVEMPDFSEEFISIAEETGNIYTGNKTYSSSNISINETMYIDGDLTINGSHFNGKGAFVVNGDITFNGSNVSNSTDSKVCFYSIYGDITLNGSSSRLDGIVYAPNGEILFNGAKQTVHGRVIGYEVRFNGGKAKIITDESDLDGIISSSTQTKPKLIR